MWTLLWTIIVILFVLWLLGLVLNWGSWLWILLVIAVILLIINLFSGRRSIA